MAPENELPKNSNPAETIGPSQTGFINLPPETVHPGIEGAGGQAAPGEHHKTDIGDATTRKFEETTPKRKVEILPKGPPEPPQTSPESPSDVGDETQPLGAGVLIGACQAICRMADDTQPVRAGVSQILEGLQDILKHVLFLKSLCPQVNLPQHFKKALDLLDCEIVTAPEGEERAYRLLFNILRRKILQSLEPDFIQKSWGEISLNRAELCILGEEPWKILYFFLRFVSLLLFCLKDVMDKKVKMQFTRVFLQALQGSPMACVDGEGKMYDLYQIFQECARHRLRKDMGVLSPADVEPKP